MRRIKRPIIKIALTGVLLLMTVISPMTVVGSAVDDLNSGSIDWWDLDLGSYNTYSAESINPQVLQLGPVRFDPKDWSDLSWRLPSILTPSYYLLQVPDPASIQPVLDHEGELFRLIDIISFDTILIDPIEEREDIWKELGNHIRAFTPYHPMFKLEGSLFHYIEKTQGQGAADLVIGFYLEPGKDLLSFLKENTLSPIVLDHTSGLVHVRSRTPNVLEIASFPEVSHVSLNGNEEIDNDVAADIIDVSEVMAAMGLNGSGQIVAVADTGLDTGINSTLHQDFSGRIKSVYTYGRSGNWSDADIHVWDASSSSWKYKGGHGTHVTGSVLGNGANSNGTYKGMAPNASLVMQSTMKSTGSLSIPAYSTLYGDAYRSGARIQTNSWSTRSSYGNYTWRSWQTDYFIWNNPDLVVLFSAGNKGTSGMYYVSTQSTSKNVISVGASESYRPSISSSANNISQIAYFSSQGPTWGDNRVKPDVVAPGTYILSPRSMLITDKWNHYWGNNATYQGVNDKYAYNGGTSMSTPIVAGMTALVRQYYEEMKDHDPTAALVKATVINGARPLNGQWSSIPNRYEGWGRVNLSNSLAVDGSDAGIMKFVDNSTGVSTGNTHSRLFTVANNNRDMVTTLVWTDYPGSNTSSTKLVNDLDLKITSPSGVIYHGNDFTSPYNSSRDSVNNVERIVIPTPEQGTYTVNVTGFSVTTGPQPYSLVISGNLSDAVGWLEWEENVVAANGSAAHVVLSDSNLTGDGWINIKVNTTSDQTGEIINLTEVKENGEGIGLFEGMIKVVKGNPNTGEVSVNSDEMVTATYDDQFPIRRVTAQIPALLNPVIMNITHDGIGKTLTYKDKVKLTIHGTKGWTAKFDIPGLSGGSNIPANDDGVAPDPIANDGNYTGEYIVRNFIHGNYTLKGSITRPFLDPTVSTSNEPLVINTNIPRKPKNLSVSHVPRGNSLRLDWDSPGDINLMSYTIHRAIESSPGSGIPDLFEKVHTTPDNRTYYVDDPLEDGITYFYMVSSFNVLGYDSEPTEWVSGIPQDTLPPWFEINSPVHQSVISRIVEVNYSTEDDAVLVEFQVAEDRNNDMVPDNPWMFLVNDTSPEDVLYWDTENRPQDLAEDEWFIIRARVVDEVENWNTTVPLARFSIDNTPPSFLEIDTVSVIAQNVSVYYLTGRTETLSSIVVTKDDQEVRTITADEDGDFEAYLELDIGVNEFTLASFDVYGNGPTAASSGLYIVYDPFDPDANITAASPVTSRSFILDGSNSIDHGPDSLLSDLMNYTWHLNFYEKSWYLYGEAPEVHLKRPGILDVELIIRDAALNWDTTSAVMEVIDDEAPSLDGVEDLFVLEDVTIELRSPDVYDNDPDIMESANFTWLLSGPEELIYYGQELSFSILTPGMYRSSLTIVDSGSNSDVVKFNITVLDTTNPIADAGENRTIVKGGMVSFSALNSTDNDPYYPSDANYTWIIRGMDIVLYGEEITFYFDQLGDHRVLLKVTDAAGNNGLDEFLLSIVTDGTAPVLIDRYPSSDIEEIGPDEDFLLEFNEPLDPATLDGGIQLIDPSGYASEANVELVDPNEVLIHPTSDLEWGGEYTIRITSLLKDITGESAIPEEFIYLVRPEFLLLSLNEVELNDAIENGFIFNSSNFNIEAVFSSSISGKIVLILVSEAGSTSTFSGEVREDGLVLFQLSGLEDGRYEFKLNGSSEYGDRIDDEMKIQLTVSDEGGAGGNGGDGSIPLWIFIAGGGAILLILILIITLLLMKRKGREKTSQEPIHKPHDLDLNHPHEQHLHHAHHYHPHEHQPTPHGPHPEHPQQPHQHH